MGPDLDLLLVDKFDQRATETWRLWHDLWFRSPTR